MLVTLRDYRVNAETLFSSSVVKFYFFCGIF